MNKFIVLYGPTAVGKTDISLMLARKINAEIINMDVGQFYKELTIGTAKPDWKNSDIAHHLFDCISEPLSISVIEYKQLIEPIMHDIWKRNKVPLLVGGSGFYLYSLLFPLKQNQLKNEENFDTLSKQELWDRLFKIDQKRALSIHINDSYRVKQALQLFYTTEQKPSQFESVFNPISAFNIIFLSRENSDLYTRINQRTENMFEEGFKSEVEKIMGTEWELFLEQKKLIGYSELLMYLRNRNILDDTAYEIMKNKISQKTRNYAKRQNTFWRYLQKKLSSVESSKQYNTCIVHLSNREIHDALEQILEHIKN